MKLPGSEPNEVTRATEALGSIGVSAEKAVPALEALVGALNQFHAEFLEIMTVDWGGLGHVVRLPNTRRWVVAGRWLLHDDDVAMPTGLWQRVLSGIVQGVRDGRHLSDGGF